MFPSPSFVMLFAASWKFSRNHGWFIKISGILDQPFLLGGPAPVLLVATTMHTVREHFVGATCIPANPLELAAIEESMRDSILGDQSGSGGSLLRS